MYKQDHLCSFRNDCFSISEAVRLNTTKVYFWNTKLKLLLKQQIEMDIEPVILQWYVDQ